MKPYSEQIAAIKKAIEPAGLDPAYLFDPKEKEALRDAASTIIAVERDEKLFLAAGDILEALEDVSATKSLIMKRSPSELELQEILKTFERVNKAIKKARFG